MTHEDHWICPLCEQINPSNAAICSHCLYWPGSSRPDFHSPGVDSTNRSLTIPQRDERPFDDRWGVPGSSPCPPEAAASRMARRQHAMGRGLRIVWGGMLALGLLAGGIGTGWWWGLGQSRPLAQDLNAAQATIARLEAAQARPAPTTATPVASRRPSAPSAAVTLSGTFSPAYSAGLVLTLVNPATGQRVSAPCVFDTGATNTIINTSLAAQLGYPLGRPSTLSGIGGTVTSALHGPILIETANGTPLWRLSAFASAPLTQSGQSPIIIGRDLLDALGTTFTVGHRTWTLRLAQAGAPVQEPVWLTGP